MDSTSVYMTSSELGHFAAQSFRLGLSASVPLANLALLLFVGVVAVFIGRRF